MRSKRVSLVATPVSASRAGARAGGGEPLAYDVEREFSPRHGARSSIGDLALADERIDVTDGCLQEARLGRTPTTCHAHAVMPDLLDAHCREVGDYVRLEVFCRIMNFVEQLLLHGRRCDAPA